MKLQKQSLIIILAVVAVGVLVASFKPSFVAAAESDNFEPAECWFEKSLPIIPGPEFECGYVTVPERHEKPGGPTIKIPVAISRCHSYRRSELIEGVAGLLSSLSFTVPRGSKVLLKPNLVAAGRPADLACTHPEFVAAVAQWFVDHGAKVAVGDSPATGSFETATFGPVRNEAV